MLLVSQVKDNSLRKRVSQFQYLSRQICLTLLLSPDSTLEKDQPWSIVEMYNLNSTLNFGIAPVFLFQLEVYCKVDRLINGPTAQQNGTTARWYSNKTSLQSPFKVVLK